MSQIYSQKKEVNDLVENVSKALSKYYWPKIGNGNPHPIGDPRIIVKPFDDVKDYIYEAWEAGSNKQDELSYVGAKFLLSTLKADKRRFASSNDEANTLYLAGMRLAKYLWDSLDSRGETGFKEDADQISDLLLSRYRNIGNDAAV